MRFLFAVYVPVALASYCSDVEQLALTDTPSANLFLTKRYGDVPATFEYEVTAPLWARTKISISLEHNQREIAREFLTPMFVAIGKFRADSLNISDEMLEKDRFEVNLYGSTDLSNSYLNQPFVQQREEAESKLMQSDADLAVLNKFGSLAAENDDAEQDSDDDADKRRCSNNNNDEAGKDCSSHRSGERRSKVYEDKVWEQAMTFPRFAVDVWIQAEHAPNYALWMPAWLGEKFKHSFRIDPETARRVMPPLPLYSKIHEHMRGLPLSAVMLDIGAHIGQSAMPVAAMGYRVVSVEPVGVSARLIEHNARESGFADRVTVIEAVASDVDGIQQIFVPPMEDNTSLLSEEVALINLGQSLNEQKVRPLNVISIVMDDWLDSHLNIRDNVRFIKIDVQGHEYFVLRGLARFFSSKQSRSRSLRLLVEWDTGMMKTAAGVTEEEVERLIVAEWGFELLEKVGVDRIFVRRGVSE